MAYGEPWTQPGRQIIEPSMMASTARRHGPRVDVPGFNATITIPLYTAFQSMDVEGIIINSDTATSGSDGSNNYTFMLRNLTTATDLMASAVTTNGNEIGENTAYTIAADQNQTISQNDVIGLVITKTGTPTNLSSADLYATFVLKVN